MTVSLEASRSVGGSSAPSRVGMGTSNGVEVETPNRPERKYAKATQLRDLADVRLISDRLH